MKIRLRHAGLPYAALSAGVALLIGCASTSDSGHAQGADALIDAAKRGELAKVQSLISQGGDVNSADGSGKTALMEAARTGRNDVVKALIAAKADLNAQDQDGWTASMRAVTAAQAVTLKTLVNAGANLSLTNNKGRTAYQIAMENGIGDIRPEVLAILTSATPSAASQTVGGEAPLIHAVKAAEPATVRVLLKSGADPNARDKKGVPALILATGVSSPTAGVAIAGDLLAAGANVNARDPKNKSALEYAVNVYQGGYDDAEKRKVYASMVYAIASYGPDDASVAAARRTCELKKYYLFDLVLTEGLNKARAGSGSASTTSTAPPKALGTAKGKPLNTKYFTATLPDGWEVLNDELDSKGMMILARKGTGGSHGIYPKFEGNGGWSGTPEADVASIAKSEKGTPPAKITMNGIAFVQTAYEAYGTRHNMLVTKKAGTKITFGIMGDDYTRSAEVKLFFDTLKLK